MSKQQKIWLIVGILLLAGIIIGISYTRQVYKQKQAQQRKAGRFDAGSDSGSANKAASTYQYTLADKQARFDNSEKEARFANYTDTKSNRF